MKKGTFEGLGEKEAKERLEKYGFNEIIEVDGISPLKILFRQVKANFVVYLLVIAAILSFIVEKITTAYTILFIVFAVIVIGFFQEYRAEKAIKSLRKLVNPISIVIRNGKEQEVLSRELVPGDIIVLRNGEKIPADCIVLEEKELVTNEAVLTGESNEVQKSVAKSEKNYKESNMVFMGTFVVNGRCVAKVVHSGMNTRFGKIAALISREEKELPLQKKINNLSKIMAVTAIALSILTGLVMLAKSAPVEYQTGIEVMIVVIALCVSAFPEGLPLVLIITLSTGVYRMAKKNAIVNRMSIIETLGETTVICSDKTGTITKGEMTAKKIFLDDRMIEISGAGYEAKGDFFENGRKIDTKKDKILKNLLLASVLCNDAKIERKGEDKLYNGFGNLTEIALMIMTAKANIFSEDIKFSRIEEIPFSSARKLMSVLCKIDSGIYVYTKGAPEILLEKCKYIQKKDGIFTLTEKERKKILETNKKLTSGAFRTLGLAYKKDWTKKKDNFEKELVFLGIVGMEDPPREEVKDAISLCKEAGIKVKMVTGDNKETALAISRQIGLEGKVILGEEIDGLTDEEFARVVDEFSIFARVRPEHKLRMVNALKNCGEIVTMTGDGVNDAPALKAAHIGVAMGKNGTDVSRDVADLTLKDDNFSTIVSAVKEGRTIFNNMRKFIAYIISCNYAEIFVITLAILIGLPLPLIALQILFMNILTDNLPDLTLALNPSSEDIMQGKPKKTSNILTKNLLIMILIAGAIMSIGTLAVYQIALNVLNQEIEIARTTALVTLIFFQLANAFNFRSFRKGVLTRSPFSNLYLVYAAIVSVIATVLIVNMPFLNKIFETSPLPLVNWTYAIVASLSIVVIFDILKAFNRKEHFWQEYL